ncbi:MAG: hypothetical protein AAFX02_00855 [Pseudomonadota bacterium]
MSSIGTVDRIAVEFEVQFVPYTANPERHQSNARRTCQTLLKRHGPEHLQQVFGLINADRIRGNWTAPCISAVSWLLLNKPAWTGRWDFLEIFDMLDLEQILTRAKAVDPSAPTATMRILLSDEMYRLIAQKEKEQAA